MSPRTLIRLTLSLLLTVILPSLAAQTSAPPAATQVSGPQVVTVGAYLMHIHEINIRDNYFTADFYLWFRWKGDNLKPYETFTLVDARQEESVDSNEARKGEPVVKKMPDGSNYAYVRVVARVTKFWDVRRYPLDIHDLDINVEEDANEDTLVRYVADENDSGADQAQISMPGWQLLKASPLIGTGTYHSNFGDISLPDDRLTRYTRFTLRMKLARDGDLLFIKLLFGVWVGAGISFLAFFIRPKVVDPRFGVGVGAIFAAIASEYVVTQSLPDTNTMTLADKLHVVAFAFIFASIIQSTLSLYLAQSNRENRSNHLDRIARWAFPILFITVNTAIVLAR